MKNLGFGLLAVSNAALLGFSLSLLYGWRWGLLAGLTLLSFWGAIYAFLGRDRASKANLDENSDYPHDPRVSQTRRNYSGAAADRILERFHKGELK